MVDNESKKPELETEALFKGLSIYLHPAALSLTRKSIFEQRIKSFGGKLIRELNESEDKVIVVFNSASIDRAKLQILIEKVKATNSNRFETFVSTDWLSKCLERKSVLPFGEFLLRTSRKVSEKTQPEASSSIYKADQQSMKSLSVTKFVCSQSSLNPTSTNCNEAITNELQKLAETYKSSNDRWRALGYEKAISAIKRYPKAISTREEAAKIPSVGPKMADKIVEILESGCLQKVINVCEGEKAKILNLFNRVWGAGPASAELWYQQGCRTLEDLSTKANLNRHQKIGVELFHDLDERMERSEAFEIEQFVRTEVTKLRKDLEVIACGSYRRGKPTCGDLDILITHQKDSALAGVFDQLLIELRNCGFLTHDLVIAKDGNQRKYLGVCRLPQLDARHRRLDIIVVSYCERAPALLYFTGSAHFNRSTRLLASKMGMSLSEHGLYTGIMRSGREKLNSGSKLPTPTERSIFEHLKIPYREPHERDH